jgi:hypothetical protein
MYTLIQSIPFRRLALEQGPALIGSLIIAEIFYKFHSFTLECIGFLVTWTVLDLLIQLVRKWLQPAA